MLATNADRAREALQTIPPDLPRDEWVKAGMAAQAAGLGFDDFNEWSAAASNYSERDARDTWRSIKPGGGIGPGTLYRMAAEHGYSLSRKKSPHKAPNRATTPPRAPRAGAVPAAEVWARCEATTALHPYIVRKGAAGVPLDGLRVLPADDKLRIGGHSMAGALVVPGFAPDGELQTLQCIPPDGPKMNLAGAPMAGASFTVGDGDGPLYVCEGIGAAWACWQATGHRAVVCFGWGNVSRVAAQLRQKEPHALLVLVPDVGKETDADKTAREAGAAVAKLPDGWASNSDVGDFAQREGLEALQSLLESAQAPDAPEPLLKPVSVADVFTHPAPPPQFVWDGYAPRGVVTLFGAHGGTGKSTVALMLAVAAVQGRPLFEVDTEQCNALFVSLEDGAGIVRHRLAGICGAWGINPQTLGGLHIVDGTEHPELYSAESRGPGEPTLAYAELARLVQSCRAGLVIVDNASDAFGGDEIQRRQVRAFMRALMATAKENNAAVILLAHVDKNTSRARRAEGGEGYSGSTAWHNSARSRLFMSRAEDGTLTLEHQKSNLGRMCEPLALEWPEGGLPQAVQALSPVVQGISDRVNTKALLRLIAEFSERGEHVTTATTSRTHAAKLLASESTYPRGMKPAEVFDLLRRAERAGHLVRELYRGADRKPRECWQVTSQGREIAELPPAAATAATPRDLEVTAPCAVPAEPCGDCGDSAGGYGGKSAHTEDAAGGEHG